MEENNRFIAKNRRFAPEYNLINFSLAYFSSKGKQ